MRIGFSCCNAHDGASMRGVTGHRHTAEARCPVFANAKTCVADIHVFHRFAMKSTLWGKSSLCSAWVPAFAGMTRKICGMTAVIIALFIAVPSFAETTTLDRKTVSSKAYVDTSVETRQQKIPAANPNNTNVGVSVVTYTNTGNGTIGERQIYDGANDYTSDDANDLVTASALKSSVTNLPTMQTSKLTCANESAGCTLWTIVEQQVYGDDDND